MADLILVTEQFANFASGVGTYARGLSRGLAERGHSVTVAVPREEAADEEGCRIVTAEFRRGNVTPFSLPRLRRHLGPLVRRLSREVDLVHFLDARWAACLGGEALPTPMLGTVHDSYALDWTAPGFPRRRYPDSTTRGLYYRWLRRLEKRVYPGFDLLLANSRHVARALATGYGVPEENVEVVHLGIPDASPVPPLPQRGDPSVLFVGGNYHRKGLTSLLEAVARVAPDLPGIVLHVVGGDPRVEHFRRLAARLGIGKRVVFEGWRPNQEVRAMMGGASLFAMPSLVEAFGLVYLEAMRAGTPVIGTSLGGAAECLRDGEEASLVPPGDVVALSDAIRRIATGADLRDRLVRAGREAVRRLSFATTLDRTEAAILRLAGG